MPKSSIAFPTELRSCACRRNNVRDGLVTGAVVVEFMGQRADTIGEGSFRGLARQEPRQSLQGRTRGLGGVCPPFSAFSMAVRMRGSFERGGAHARQSSA